MKTIKIAEELFNKFKIDDFPYQQGITKDMFIEAIAEHDREIIELIDDEIERYNLLIDGCGIDVDNLVYMQAVIALTELKEEIEGGVK